MSVEEAFYILITIFVAEYSGMQNISEYSVMTNIDNIFIIGCSPICNVEDIRAWVVFS